MIELQIETTNLSPVQARDELERVVREMRARGAAVEHYGLCSGPPESLQLLTEPASVQPERGWEF